MTDVRAIQITKVLEEFNGKSRLQCRILARNYFFGVFNNEVWISQDEFEMIGKEMGWIK